MEIKINDIIGRTEGLKLAISQMKDLDWNNPSATNNFFLDYWVNLIPDDFPNKENIVSKLKIASERKLYSKISFTKFFLENK